ncbi:MAG: CDP-alcohol phosphatidyltransferase family protein [Polyangia bacterium]
MKRGAELAFAAWMLAAVAVAVWRREAVWCGAGGLVALGVRIVAAHDRWTPSRRFGVANTLTLVRLLLVAALALLYGALPRLAFVALVLTLLALDAVDGRIARARGECSEFGAAFDMETDALSIMMLSLLLWQHGLAPAWVLAAGLWRYAYAAFVALVPSLGEAPRSDFARVVFVVLALSLTLAFLPLPTLAPWLAGLGTVLVSISFLRSFVYSLPGAR